ncbi:hypothetical protein GCU67_03315 [Modestobacter muralis]|uniref:Uncharacterized protein n=1 Tax=Modestobacter muralis TaxID=1608614 RepID=A0A6P0ERV9_9ACTN|nr:hypothetical protein [Modestobacter muralis]NEK93209.1 hypothetical protein [Modestobacter muralis]NEN49976.1 hypothetical protein [Modestobacter muralis]
MDDAREPAAGPYEDDPELGGSPNSLRSPDAIDDPEDDAEADLAADMEDGHAT